MIRFHSLLVRNFALYPDALLVFSVDPEHPLTAIRGENECGKTTLMRAFLWALYGETGLPEVRNTMHPIRPVWEGNDPVRTRVELRFEARASRGAATSYKLVREATTQVVNGLADYRDEETILMLKQDDGNWGPADDQLLDLLMHRYFRPELRDFFFIDADKAVRFVGGPEGEHDDSLMRTTTTQAIYNLLGLDYLRNTADRLELRKNDFLRQSARHSGDIDQQQFGEDLEAASAKKAAAEKQLTALQQKETRAQTDVKEAERKLDSDVRRMTSLKGLTESISDATARKTSAREHRAEQISKLTTFIEGDERVVAALMLPAINSVFDMLDPLYQEGRIPPTELTLLPRILRDGTCVCGLKFNEHPERKQEVQRRFRESQQLEQSAHFLGDVLEAARWLGNRGLGHGVRPWDEDARTCQDELAVIDQKLNGVDTELESLIARRDAAGNMSEPAYVEKQRHLTELRSIAQRASEDRRIAEEDAKKYQADVRSLSEKLRTAQTGKQRSQDLRDSAEVASDLQDVVIKALNAIELQQVAELSSVMNRIFKDVIGATSDSNFSEVGIRAVPGGGGPRTEYEPYALSGEREKPLAIANGASRRALAVSFVLALAETTGSSVPFVADSLLHAFSGGVLRRMVGYLIDGKRVGQPILFGHTHDFLDEEIRASLMEAAGKTYTVTNQAHVGGDVVRAAPQRQYPQQTVVCECGINEYCGTCERVGYDTNPRFIRNEDRLF